LVSRGDYYDNSGIPTREDASNIIVLYGTYLYLAGLAFSPIRRGGGLLGKLAC
jgi:hypothetical protein